MASLINYVAHGLSAGDAFQFANVLPTDSGIDETKVYYVLATGLTADAFQFSETDGGVAVTLDYDIESGDIIEAYAYELKEDGFATVPDPVATPSAPTVSSSLVDGVVRLTVDLPAPGEAKLRLTEVAVTREYSTGTPVWTDATIHSVAPDLISLSVPALGTTDYSVRLRYLDVYGQYSSWSTETDHTTTAGLDSLATAAALTAAEAAALDHEITETEIADDSISTPKLRANAVTANKIAAGTITTKELAVGAQGNLLANGSFEDYFGTLPIALTSNAVIAAALPGWGSQAITSTATMRVFASAAPYHGSVILEIVQGSTPGTNRLHGNLIPVLPGARLRFRAWVKGVGSNSANAEARIVATYFDNTGTSISSVAIDNAVVGTSSAWVELRGDGTAPAGTAYVRWSAENRSTSSASDAVYFDACSMRQYAQEYENDGATVLINENGITITDGALTFEDAYGQTSMDAYGFGRQWLRYVQNRVFNADFTAGSTSDIAVTEVSGGDSVADYRASISTDLPGWVVEASGGVIRRQTDSAASGGSYLSFEHTGSGGSQTSSIYQDIPVVPGEKPRIRRSWRCTRSANDVAINIYASYRDVNHAIIGSESGSGLVFSSTISSYVQQADTLLVGTAPANAAYLRYRFEVVHNTGAGTTVRLNDIVFDLEPGAVTKQATSSLTLTTSDQDIAGLTYTAEKGRDYMVTWHADFNVSATDPQVCSATLYVDGAAITSPVATFRTNAATARSTVGQTVIVSTSPTGTGVIKVMAKKSNNAGTASALIDHSTMTVLPI